MEFVERISNLVKRQFPEFYQEDGENFIAFITAYYEYMEQEGKATSVLRNLKNYKNIDTTLDEYLEYFRRDLLPSVPTEALADKALMAKYIKNFNLSRGTLASYKLLFRALYNEDIDVRYPADQILKVSDGDWRLERYLVTSYDSLTYKFIGKTIKGVDSDAEALVEDIVRRNVRGRDLMQIILSNIRGTFNNNEPIRLLTDTNSSGHAPIVEAGINSIQIISPGSNYAAGDVVSLISEQNGDFGKVVVTETQDLGGVLTFEIKNGGSGYTPTIDAVYGSTDVKFVGGDGSELATFVISRDDIVDTFALSVNLNMFSSNNVFGENAPLIDDVWDRINDDGTVTTITTRENRSTLGSNIICSPRYGFKEAGETTTKADFHDHANAVINVANNTYELRIGQSIHGVSSEANGQVIAIVDPTPGDAWVRVNTYGTFQVNEDLKVGSLLSGNTVGKIIEFQANTIGYHVLDIANTDGVEITAGSEVVGSTPFNDIDSVIYEPNFSFGVIKDVLRVQNYAYEYNATSNTVLSGTITAAANTVTGSGTSFLTDFQNGDVIKVDGYRKRVAAIHTDTELITASEFDPAITSASAYGRGGKYRSIVTTRVGANNSANSFGVGSGRYSQFRSGPMGAFYENEGLRLVGSSSPIGNVVTSTSNTIIENMHTRLRDSLVFEASVFGTIGQLSLVDGGTNYTVAPEVVVREPDIASLGIGECWMTLQTDENYWGTGDPTVTKLDTNDRIVQVETGAIGDVKGSLNSAVVTQTQHANGTYETTLRLWQKFGQKVPGNVYFIGPNHLIGQTSEVISSGSGSSTVTYYTYQVGQETIRRTNPLSFNATIEVMTSEYIPGEIDTRTRSAVGTGKIISVIDNGVLGENANIEASVGADGTISKVKMVDSGFAYRNNEEVFVEDQGGTNARVKLGLGGVANSEGYYATTRSQISTARGYIHDNHYYQEFSYEIGSPISLQRYKDIAMKLVHPSGQIMFGKYLAQSNVNVDIVANTVHTKLTRVNGFVNLAKTRASGYINLTNNSADIVGTSTDLSNEFLGNRHYKYSVSQALGYANVASGSITSNSVVIYRGGKYVSAPTVTISAPQTSGGVTATATAVMNGSEVANLSFTNTGTGYTNPPTITFSVEDVITGSDDYSANLYMDTSSEHNYNVFKNGTLLLKDTDYTVDSKTQITLATAPEQSDIVDVYVKGDKILVEYDHDKYRLVTLNHIANTTSANLELAWKHGNKLGANIYFNRNWDLTATSSSFGAGSFSDGDVITIKTSDGALYKTKINNVITNLTANLETTWVGPDITNGIAYYETEIE
jgi:hypothetical protein